MKGTVVSINPNAKHNGKDYFEIVTQGDPYKGQEKPPRTHKLFMPYAKDLIEQCKAFKPGDYIEYKTDDSQYKNMISIVPAVPWGGAPTTATTAGGGQTKAPYQAPARGNDVTKSIARAASMKEATQIVLFGAKKTTQVDELSQEIMQCTRELEKFLMFETPDPNPGVDVVEEEEDAFS